MNYQQTLDYLFSQFPAYHLIGKAAFKADLTNTIELCNLLNNPQHKLKCIHVAGTNGKGSTSHLIASVLQEAGYKTGLFTSPHLKDFRERIKINGQPVSEQKVIDFVSKNQADFAKIKASFFEITTAMAFSFFAEEQVDYAIIETGLGGRLDSTNIIHPILSVITNIGIDHTNFLGTTLAQIAYEKAGIIKPNTPIVIGESLPETQTVFISKANLENAPIVFSKDIPPIDLISPLNANYQTKNKHTAYTAILSLRNLGLSITDTHLTTGFANIIKNTNLMGRWQTIALNPLTICDVGHNVDGIRSIIEQLALENYSKLHFIIGLANDKDIDGVLELLPKDAIYYFTQASVPRALNHNELSRKAQSYLLNGNSYETVALAYASAKNAASPLDMIFIGGSFFVVAEII